MRVDVLSSVGAARGKGAPRNAWDGYGVDVSSVVAGSQPCLRFDGSSTPLQAINGMGGQPHGNSIRTFDACEKKNRRMKQRTNRKLFKQVNSVNMLGKAMAEELLGSLATSSQSPAAGNDITLVDNLGSASGASFATRLDLEDEVDANVDRESPAFAGSEVSNGLPLKQLCMVSGYPQANNLSLPGDCSGIPLCDIEGVAQYRHCVPALHCEHPNSSANVPPPEQVQGLHDPQCVPSFSSNPTLLFRGCPVVETTLLNDKTPLRDVLREKGSPTTPPVYSNQGLSVDGPLCNEASRVSVCIRPHSRDLAATNKSTRWLSQHAAPMSEFPFPYETMEPPAVREGPYGPTALLDHSSLAAQPLRKAYGIVGSMDTNSTTNILYRKDAHCNSLGPIGSTPSACWDVVRNVEPDLSHGVPVRSGMGSAQFVHPSPNGRMPCDKFIEPLNGIAETQKNSIHSDRMQDAIISATVHQRLDLRNTCTGRYHSNRQHNQRFSSPQKEWEVEFLATLLTSKVMQQIQDALVGQLTQDPAEDIPLFLQSAYGIECSNATKK